MLPDSFSLRSLCDTYLQQTTLLLPFSSPQKLTIVISVTGINFVLSKKMIQATSYITSGSAAATAAPTTIIIATSTTR
jgi:hypothetical protein